MLKVREAMASGRNDPMDGVVHVDELVLGGREEGKTGRCYHGKKKNAVTAVQLTKDGKVKRMYAIKIDDFPPGPYNTYLLPISTGRPRSLRIIGGGTGPFHRLMT